MKQVKTKKRVEDHGEVFTHEREVNAILDMVYDETQRIESRFLEPACGTGNFLVEILNRKLAVVEKKYRRSQFDFERNLIVAVSSLYGVDILSDNVKECRERLSQIIENKYKSAPKSSNRPEFMYSIKYIISKNIIWGDALTLKLVDGSDRPIVFSEWSPINGTQIKRRDYTLSKLLAYQPMEEENLFSDLGQEAFIPKPIREFPLTHYLRLGEHA